MNFDFVLEAVLSITIKLKPSSFSGALHLPPSSQGVDLSQHQSWNQRNHQINIHPDYYQGHGQRDHKIMDINMPPTQKKILASSGQSN